MIRTDLFYNFVVDSKPRASGDDPTTERVGAVAVTGKPRASGDDPQDDLVTLHLGE